MTGSGRVSSACAAIGVGVILVVMLAVWPIEAAAAGDAPREVARLQLPPNEASALLAVESESLLMAAGFDRGFWLVSDEGRAEDVLMLAGRSRDASNSPRWSIWRVDVAGAAPTGGKAPKTDDAEALFRIGSHVYVVGSHFGKKAGPVQAKRQFFARFDERTVELRPEGVAVKMQIVRDAFRVHRAVNEALADSGIDVIERSPVFETDFIAPARAKYDASDGGDRIHPGDRPINVEGAAALESGNVLLGLRYPVSATGAPLVVEIEGIGSLFGTTGVEVAVRRVFTLAVPHGDGLLRGVRALDRAGDTLHAIVGHIDSDPSESALLRVHSNGLGARSEHVEIEGGVDPGTKPLPAIRRHEFETLTDVEGISVGADDVPYYVRDAPHSVPVYR